MELEAISNHHKLETQERFNPLSVYASLFVQRFDTFARQRNRSRMYFRVLQADESPVPLTPSLIASHLRGEITVGLYSIGRNGLTTWSVIDSDEGVSPLIEARAALHTDDIPSYLELSRAGGHLWIFWKEPVRPNQARKILSPYSKDLELFPAGDIPDEDGLGLLIRAPLGVHRFTGQRYPFVDENMQPVSPGVAVGQIQWLISHVQQADAVPHLQLLEASDRLRVSTADRVSHPSSVSRGAIAKWVRGNDIGAVIGQYVQVNRRGLGHCPWGEQHKHGDRHASFQVFSDTQRWWCYTERVGGNAFDFLCRYHSLSAREMLTQLKEGWLGEPNASASAQRRR
jgi:hypothetical protein